MYWGARRLEKELRSLISDYSPERIDGAAYRLRVGPEVYVSPTGEPHDPRTKTKLQLAEGQAFSIPPGQFGYLLTEETVTIPHSALGFISIRAKYKFAGLVNVSGFHVDPNYSGRLIFAVFNAGPSMIHLSRGDDCFLIWYADLDGPGDKNALVKRGYDSLPSHLTGSIGSGIQSFDTLLQKINDNDKKINDRLIAIERDSTLIKAVGAIAAAAIVGGIVKTFLFDEPKNNTAPQSTPSQVSTTLTRSDHDVGNSSSALPPVPATDASAGPPSH